MVLRALLAFVLAFGAGAAVYPMVIGWLARAGVGQPIREEGPPSHQSRSGTPTAGGIVFLALGLILYLVFDRSRAGGLVLLALLGGGGLGLVDDLRKVLARQNLGLRAREKVLIQLLTGLVLAFLGWRWGFAVQAVPFWHPVNLGAWLIPLGAVAFVAGTNAFNLTDGSDGLAAGVGAIAFATLTLIALRSQHAAAAWLPAILTGLLLAFLVYNLSPARVFMGDTGSLALGNALVAAAIVGGVLWYLPVLAVVLVAETVSVIAQVASFKRTGRRILRMSPLHNHFILGGWSDTRVALSFWAVGLIAALLTLALAPAGGRA
ncbi:MAG: phospho-N-acetylmuramoyl-pentapeptide-transferase [Chloroflexi bacterium]|nr:MAG: phospho-N-acetylmuramoyl-pentapeptide-transferase [Chloroflexota bacterium]